MDNVLWIYDFIGEGFFEVGVTAKGVRDDLAKLDRKQKLIVRVNSPGGDVFEGIAIRAQIAEWESGVDFYVDGLAGSMASHIITLPGTVIMANGSMIMAHMPWTIAVGNADNLAKEIATLRKIEGDFAKVYADKSGQTIEVVRKMLADETWFTVDEAIEFGLADEKSEVAAAAFTIPKKFGFKHAPQPPKEPEQRPSGHLAILQRQLDLARSVAIGAKGVA
jgi:ATP-dependent Clp protease, protease subunit